MIQCSISYCTSLLALHMPHRRTAAVMAALQTFVARRAAKRGAWDQAVRKHAGRVTRAAWRAWRVFYQ